MKMNLDDPDLTAFALGELAEPKRSAIARAVAESPEAQEIVDELREVAGVLRSEFRRDLAEPISKPSNILPLRQEQSFWSDSRWGSLAVAALVAICAVVAAVMLSGGGDRTVAKRETILQMEMVNLPPARPVQLFAENQFVLVATNPVSTFAFNVDTASYENVKRTIETGSLPPKEAVQIEAMVNAFTYDYSEPDADKTFAIAADAVTCPWASEHRLVRIAVNPRQAGRGLIAKDVRIQVEFNPARVSAYRLIGYEKMTAGPPLSSEPNGEEVRGGRAVTALYEVVPNAATTGTPADQMLTVRLSHRNPETGRTEVAEHALANAASDFATAPPDLKFAVAVAEFGLILRGSAPTANANLASVLASAEAGRGHDPAGDRAGFIELVRKAQALVSSSG
jgi:Ca-activated chloride channel family protein